MTTKINNSNITTGSLNSDVFSTSVEFDFQQQINLADGLAADGIIYANSGVVGAVTGNLTGNVTGDVTGNLAGNVTGDVTGDLTGSVTAGAGKTVDVSGGTLTLASDQISGDKVEGGTIDGITINALTSTSINSTLLTGSMYGNVSSNIISVDTGMFADTIIYANTGVVANSAVFERYNEIASSDIDLSSGNFFSKTISGATTFTISNARGSNIVNSFILELTNGGSATVTWFSGVTWASATAPTLTTSGLDILGFYTLDGGTTWRGLVLAQAVA